MTMAIKINVVIDTAALAMTDHPCVGDSNYIEK